MTSSYSRQADVEDQSPLARSSVSFIVTAEDCSKPLTEKDLTRESSTSGYTDHTDVDTDHPLPLYQDSTPTDSGSRRTRPWIAAVIVLVLTVGLVLGFILGEARGEEYERTQLEPSSTLTEFTVTTEDTNSESVHQGSTQQDLSVSESDVSEPDTTTDSTTGLDNAVQTPDFIEEPPQVDGQESSNLDGDFVIGGETSNDPSPGIEGLLPPSGGLQIGIGAAPADSWPELVGLRGEVAAKRIEDENKGYEVILVHPGEGVTRDFRTDRVFIFVNDQGYVEKIPAPGRL